jgi:hypothetical protein
VSFALAALTICLWSVPDLSAQERAVPIPPPPADKSLLPVPLAGVVMVRVENGRLNVPLGGWGGQRLIQAKTDPEKFRGFMRALRQRGLNVARPLFHPPNAANKNDAEWAKFDWEAMDRAVAITQEEGVYFLVDYHNWRVNDTIHVDEAIWLKNWGWIVERYKPYKHLVFEGYNEPQNQCACMADHYQKWLDMVHAKGAPQLCVVSPFWGKYFPLNDPSPAGSNWAQCRHHYFNAGNAATEDKARKEADWQLANTGNANSAASAVAKFGCGFFMTEGGQDDKPKTDADKAARLAGIQRVVDICEKNGYGWCLWAHGDWADGFDTVGGKIKTGITYSSITGMQAKGR